MQPSDLPVDPPPSPTLGSLARGDGTVLAYYKTKAGKASRAEGADGPGVVFLGGFMSDMSGLTAQALEASAQRRGRDFVRFHYRGPRASSVHLAEAPIGAWVRTAVAPRALPNHTTPPPLRPPLGAG